MSIQSLYTRSESLKEYSCRQWTEWVQGLVKGKLLVHQRPSWQNSLRRTCRTYVNDPDGSLVTWVDHDCSASSSITNTRSSHPKEFQTQSVEWSPRESIFTRSVLFTLLLNTQVHSRYENRQWTRCSLRDLRALSARAMFPSQ